MKQMLALVKTTVVGGLLVMVPLIVVGLMLTEIFDVLIGIVTPFVDWMPEFIPAPFDGPVMLACLFFFVSSFIFGLALRSAFLRGIGKKIESMTIGRLALYHAIKRLARGMMGDTSSESFGCGFLLHGNGMKQLVYIVEDTPELVTVIAPTAPSGLSGPVYIVPRERVEKVDISVGDASLFLSNWGVGINKAHQNKRVEQHK